MSKLTWIISALLWVGCVTTQPLQDDKAAAVGKPAVSVEETVSKSASSRPVPRTETATSRSVARQSLTPVKSSAPILSVSSHTETARVVKTDAPTVAVTNAKPQEAKATAPTPLTLEQVPEVKHEETRANIVIKGTPKETKSNEKLSGRKTIWAGIAGGLAIAVGGWVFVQRNGKLSAKGKNSNSKSEAKDEMEKAWKKGGVF